MAVGFLNGIASELFEMYQRAGVNHSVLVGAGNGMRKNRVLRKMMELVFRRKLYIPAHKEEAAYGAVAQVVVDDDVAVDGSLYTVGRRGVAGTVFVHKIAGAKAEEGAELEEVQRVAQKVIDNVRTMGVAIRPCTVPAAGKPGFELGEDEMEVGIGIHGEPGTHKESLRPADEIVDHILDKILSDIDYTGHEVAVMVNSSGATPLMELFIINNHVADVLAAKGIRVYKTFVGEYMTSLEMEGFSVSLLRLDDEMKALLDAHADTIAFKA